MCLRETQYNRLTVEGTIHEFYMCSTVLCMRLQYSYWTREHSYNCSASSGEAQERTLQDVNYIFTTGVNIEARWLESNVTTAMFWAHHSRTPGIIARQLVEQKWRDDDSDDDDYVTPASSVRQKRKPKVAQSGRAHKSIKMELHNSNLNIKPEPSDD
ncbi:hypothetical protein WG66_004637 [Moniliophthora roreri]|nr:hypothetical protein WG66_004637 [Moniliophthora roreri]